MDRSGNAGVGIQTPLGPICTTSKIRGQYCSKVVWNPVQLFPAWAKAEMQVSGSKPHWAGLGPLQNRRTRNVRKGAGAWPPFSQHGPKWKSMGQVPNPFGSNLVPLKMKGTKMIPKGFGTRPSLFPHGPKWKSEGQVPDPFGPKLSQKETYTCSLIAIGQPIEPLGFPTFPTWTKMEK